MNASFDLLIVGDANPDVVLHGAPRTLAYGQTEQLVDDGSLAVGGSAGITACAAARLGLRTAFVSLVGDDVAGRFMLDELGRCGVDVSGVVVRDDLATGLTVALTRGDDRAIVTSTGCMSALSAGDVDHRLVQGARHLHVSSFYLQPGLAPGVRGLFEAAHTAGASTSLDLNWDPSLVWDGGLADALPVVDVLFVNGAEAAAVSGAPDPAVAATILAARGPLPVIKLGAAGALAHDGGRPVRVRAPVVTVVDTVGAGDTFDAGYLCGRLLGWDVSRCLALGVACGSLSAQGAGGVAAQPTLEQARAVAGGLLPPPGDDARPESAQ